MTIQTIKDDDIYSINKATSINVIPVHASSRGAPKDNFLKYLKLAKPGDVVGGDWNVNFLIPKNLKELVEALKTAKLKIKISDEEIAKLSVWYKCRSEEELFSTQIMKNGEADVFLKDLAFEVEALKEGEDPIPAALRSKIAELTQVRTNFIAEFNALKKEHKDYNDASIDRLAKKHGVINFHDPKASHYDDHSAVAHVKQTEDGQTYISYFKNTIQHSAYDLKGHFKDNVDTSDLTHLKQMYRDLGKLALEEAAALLAKRDGLEVKDFSEKSSYDLKVFINARLDECKTNINKVELTTFDIRQLFEHELRSKQLNAINSLLRSSYDLTNEDFVQKRLSFLTDEKHMAAYKESISKVIDVVLRCLDKEIPTPDLQSISLQGNGFPPFDKSIEEIEREQIQTMKSDLDTYHKLYPTAEINANLIECVNKKGKISQPEKCKEIEEYVVALNKESAALKASVVPVSMFTRKPAVNAPSLTVAPAAAMSPR